MSLRLTIDGEPVEVSVVRTGDRFEARVGDGTFAGTARRDGDTVHLELGGRVVAATVVRARDEIWVALDGEIYRCAGAAEERDAAHAGAARSPRVTAPMPGKVLDVAVREGQTVAAGDPLVILEAMKMETVATADAAGVVRKVHVVAGALVEPGQLLVELELA
ncbi:MAG TPA: biotin/lipoyl-containing protein [Candidatus Binatia bacterium]|jgi:acetyl/propionyl-CoA carboxylase alpha subunit